MNIPCDTPRHGPRGSGAHYADRIKKLNRTHNLALLVLRARGAVSYEKGLGLSEIWRQAREMCLTMKYAGKVPTKQGLSGRLSELQGLGMVRSENNQVRLVDRDSHQFRYEKQPRWFLATSSSAG